MKTPHNFRNWTLAAAMALALGTLGAGVANADPNEGVSGGAGSDTGVGVNLGPDGVSAGADRNAGGGLNLGPVSGGAGSKTGVGAHFGSAHGR